MTAPTAQRTAAPTRIHVPAWAWAVVLLALFALYLMASDNGAVLAQAGTVAHEFFHDARHALGIPCH